MDDFDAWLTHSKSLWARVYDEVILPDVNKEWKKRTCFGHATSGPRLIFIGMDAYELESKSSMFFSHYFHGYTLIVILEDEELRILRDHVSNGVVKNAKLTYENTRLQNLLEKHGIAVPNEELNSNTPEVQIPATEFNDVVNQLHDLNKRHQDAAKRLKYLERKNVAVMQKNKDMKESVKAWQDYAERHLERKRMKSEGGTSTEQTKSHVTIQTPRLVPFMPSSPVSAAVRSPRSPAPQQGSSPTPLVELETGADSPRGDQEERGGLAVDNRHLLPRLPSGGDNPGAISILKDARPSIADEPAADKVTSSQTTVPETTEQENEMTPRAVNMTKDDDPEFLYGRSLKRKRDISTNASVFYGEPDGTPAKPVRVKEELYSSPPPDAAVDASLRKEMIDLDELGPNPIMTPRHRRQKRLNSILSIEPGTGRDQRSNSIPFSGNLIKAEPTEVMNMTELEDIRAVSEPTGTPMKSREILQPLDPNIVAGRADTSNKRIKAEEARHETEINNLAEPGETGRSKSHVKKRLPPSLARAHFNERIRANKSGPSPTKSALKTPKSAPAKTSTAQVSDRDLSNHTTLTPCVKPSHRHSTATTPRSELVPDDRPVWRMGALEPARKAPIPPRSRSQDRQGQLRDKPIAELGVKDFKVNPAYNGGFTHAFTDTVRRREDRLCLPGCTNPSCCGSTFRSLALAAPRLSSSQEEGLLEDYLGDAYDSFGLTQMSKEERDEIVLQARTRKLATEHGKHRRVYEGRKTPPGFWRVDFPNTQEQEEDREKAAQMEQVEIRNRWLEAMRKGGRYIFADE